MPCFSFDSVNLFVLACRVLLEKIQVGTEILKYCTTLPKSREQGMDQLGMSRFEDWFKTSHQCPASCTSLAIDRRLVQQRPELSDKICRFVNLQQVWVCGRLDQRLATEFSNVFYVILEQCGLKLIRLSILCLLGGALFLLLRFGS